VGPVLPNFDWIDVFSILDPLGIFLDICVLACSAWLSAIARSWRGWTIYVVLTALMLFPLTYMVLYVKMHPPGTHAGLGVGLHILFTAAPLALAWLLGLPIGLLCRLVRSKTQSAQ
jgi:hypothetical protein